jgi:dUTP pyrophosphatase
MDRIDVILKRLPHADGFDVPQHETELSAGMDLRAAVPDDDPITLASGAHALVPTGLQIALPAGYEGQVRPRSGLAMRHGVTVLSAPAPLMRITVAR